MREREPVERFSFLLGVSVCNYEGETERTKKGRGVAAAKRAAHGDRRGCLNVHSWLEINKAGAEPLQKSKEEGEKTRKKKGEER